MRKLTAAAGSAVFFAVAPGVVAGLVPWLISGWQAGHSYPPPLRIAGAILVAAGVLVLADAFGRFVIEGMGTPAPTAPTQPDRAIRVKVLPGCWEAGKPTPGKPGGRKPTPGKPGSPLPGSREGGCLGYQVPPIMS